MGVDTVPHFDVALSPWSLRLATSFYREREREKERKRQRERERQTERKRERESEGEIHRETERQRPRERHRERERARESESEPFVMQELIGFMAVYGVSGLAYGLGTNAVSEFIGSHA